MQSKKALAIVLVITVILGGCSTENGDKTERGNDMSNGFFSRIINRIMGDAPKQDNPNDHTENFDNDMHYYYLSDSDAEAKRAIAVAKKTLVPKSNWTYKLYPRFRIGNMAFIEIHEIPTIFIHDLNKQPYYVVVLLGVEPQLIRTPDKELFTKFMNAVRSDSDLMTPTQRLRTALILAIGGSGENIEKDEIEPSWTDENGVLIISYRTYIRSDNGMLPPRKVARTITVDENQDFMIEDQDLDNE